MTLFSFPSWLTQLQEILEFPRFAEVSEYLTALSKKESKHDQKSPPKNQASSDVLKESSCPYHFLIQINQLILAFPLGNHSKGPSHLQRLGASQA